MKKPNQYVTQEEFKQFKEEIIDNINKTKEVQNNNFS